jgi:hypothetical protein
MECINATSLHRKSGQWGTRPWVGKQNCRSLGLARDDKGEGSVHLSSRYEGMDSAAAGYPRFSFPLVGRKARLALGLKRSVVEGPAVSLSIPYNK